jgi:hypothetical protein
VLMMGFNMTLCSLYVRLHLVDYEIDLFALVAQYLVKFDCRLTLGVWVPLLLIADGCMSKTGFYFVSENKIQCCNASIA